MNKQQIIAQQVNQLIPDAAVFYQKLRNYHWNIKGEVFFELHEKFEELYTEWSDVIDTLAERVLMLGGRPYSTLREMVDNATLEERVEFANEREVVEHVVEVLDILSSKMSAVSNEAATEGDRGTIFTLDSVVAATEKHAWMLRTWLAR